MSTTEAKVLRTKSEKAADDVAALLRARNPLIWVRSSEEQRVEGFLAEAAAAAGYEVRFWDVGAGVSLLNGKAENPQLKDIQELLGTIQSRAENGVAGKPRCRTVWVLRDPEIWLEGLPGAVPTRLLRNLARFLPGCPSDKSQAIIVLAVNANLPASLSAQTSVIEWPLPERVDIAKILDGAVKVLPEKDKDSKPFRALVIEKLDKVRDAAIDAAVGLTSDEAASCFAKSIVQFREVDPTAVATEKKRVVTREKVLEWYDPIPGGLDAVGGLDVLKTWLNKRRLAYSPAARAYGLPAPKGVLLVGVPGCGKSLTAKAISTAWGVPLLKLDLGALKGKFVGESEQNIRKALRVIEAIGRCVVWIDEIEKALQGATSGSADGGVSSDALGVVLTWLQERTNEAFVIATANDVSGLPPELLRKGRWDEIFFVDLPNVKERAAIVEASLRAHGREGAIIGIDAEEVAAATEDFSGAEIAALIPDALFVGFADGGREITTQDIVDAAGPVVPLAKSAEAKIKALRDWAKANARKATPELTGTVEQFPVGARQLEIG